MAPKPKIYFCSTHYNTLPPVDINPLILRLYPTGQLLAICAREGMKLRIDKMTSSSTYQGPKIDTIGAWELDKAYRLSAYDAIVVIGKGRIDKQFLPTLNRLLE